MSESTEHYLDKIEGVHSFSKEFRIELASNLVHIDEAMRRHSGLTERSSQLDDCLVALLTRLYRESDRDPAIGNLVADSLLERAIEQPSVYISETSRLLNGYFFELLMKSFQERILKESSFEILKTLALLIRQKDNYRYFKEHFGFEFLYSLIKDNHVLIDGQTSAKSIVQVLDAALFNASQEDVHQLVSMFFSSEVQAKVGFMANFLSDLVSLLLVHGKVGANPEIMPALANNKTYLVAAR